MKVKLIFVKYWPGFWIQYIQKPFFSVIYSSPCFRLCQLFHFYFKLKTRCLFVCVWIMFLLLLWDVAGRVFMLLHDRFWRSKFCWVVLLYLSVCVCPGIRGDKCCNRMIRDDIQYNLGNTRRMHRATTFNCTVKVSIKESFIYGCC